MSVFTIRHWLYCVYFRVCCRYLVGRQLVNYGGSPTELFIEEVEDSEPVQESGEQ